MPTGTKCAICNSCTEYRNHKNHLFLYCEFCNIYYYKVPGKYKIMKVIAKDIDVFVEKLEKGDIVFGNDNS